ALSPDALPPSSTRELSLHDALPIYQRRDCASDCWCHGALCAWQETRRTRRSSLGLCCGSWSYRCSSSCSGMVRRCSREASRGRRSEEHTSELQSRENLVCRLLPEKQ